MRGLKVAGGVNVGATVRQSGLLLEMEKRRLKKPEEDKEQCVRPIRRNSG